MKRLSMKNNNQVNSGLNFQEIYLVEVLSSLWNKKLYILIFSFFTTSLFVIYSLFLPNIYTSSALLLASEEQDSLSSNISRFSPFASLTGVNLTEVSKSLEAIKRIESFEFFSKLFVPNIKYENLVAAKKWDPELNQVIYNEDLFSKGEWLETSHEIPSLQLAYLDYRSMLQILDEKNTPFVRISIKHVSPNIAKEWVDLVISQINMSIQNEDRLTAERSIDFLNNYYINTNIQSMKESTSVLIESQMQKLMFVSSTNNYVFKVIDSPIVPERSSEPRRLSLVILGTFLGLFISTIIIVLLYIKDGHDINLQK